MSAAAERQKGHQVETQASATSGSGLRFLHVLDTVDPRSGGPAASLEVLKYRSAYGCTEEVATFDKPDSAFLDALPYKVHAFGADHWINRAMPVYRYRPDFVPWLKARAADYDLVIAHGIWAYPALGVWQALRGTRTPYAVYTHGMMDPWFKTTYPLKHLKKQAYWSLYLGRVMDDAAMVLFTAEDERLLARGVFRGRGHYRERIVKFGTIAPPPAAPGQREAFLNLLPTLENRRYILFLSRIDPKKGCDLLIEAFAAVSAAHPDLDLVMAGPARPEYRAELERIARDRGVEARIHWPGMVSGDAKWGAFRGAEAFALTSHQENFGIAVAEALACGTPVLISNKINIWREIESAGAGLVGSDDIAGASRVVADYFSLPPEGRAAMGERARALFTDRFDVATSASDLVDIARNEILPAYRP